MVICQIALFLIFGAGLTIGLVLAFRLQLDRKRGLQPLAALGTLQARPFRFAHALPIVALTGLFAFLHVLQPSGEETHVEPIALVWGSGIVAVLNLLVIASCTVLAGKRPRVVFGSPSCPWYTAIGKGLVYGVAVIPVVSLVSLVVEAVASALDLTLDAQDVFNCLSDPAVPASIRAALIFFALVVAPITEELMFRGILLPVLAKGRHFIFAALLSSLLFALIHLHGPSFLTLMLLSVFFSLGYAATGSILTPIVMHMIFNITGLLFFFASVSPGNA